MFRSLTWKLSLAFSLVAVIVALLVAVSIQLSSAGNFDRFIVEQGRSDLKANLVAYYQAHGSWDDVDQYVDQQYAGPGPQFTLQPGATADFGGGSGRPDFRRERHRLFGVVDAQGVVVVPLLPQYPRGVLVSSRIVAQGEPVIVDGETVGTILTASRPPGLAPEESAYLQRAGAALLLATSGAILAAFVVGLLLARTLTRPLHALTEAAHRMAGGALEQEVPVKSADELGQLAAAFNRMSREVARANNARRQMTADIAHELRTPLTVIAGYIESMRDGVLKSTPERLSVIYDEIEHLQHLVGDLRILSQADAGELKLSKQLIVPQELLQQALVTFEHQAAQKGVRLEVQAGDDLPAVPMDEMRMTQVMANLISNALRYTPTGGQIVLGAAHNGDGVTLSVRDTGQGISGDDLPFVFDRLYRADKSRAEENGESGLGLAIAKAIVEAHSGRIEALSEGKGHGSVFTIHLRFAEGNDK